MENWNRRREIHQNHRMNQMMKVSSCLDKQKGTRMGTDILKKKLGEQQKVYESLKKGDVGLVCYKENQNGKWGVDDANYTNRLRLAYYLLYWKIEDENIIRYLFEEELKDRENNSFQGIGSTLWILTGLLRKYNKNHKYEELFKRAKNANFDCACGYDAEMTVNDDFESNDLLDCIYLCQEMDYKDVMSTLVEEWKRDMDGWDLDQRSRLIGFYTYLGREEENEALYQAQLEEIMWKKGGKTREIISGYKDLICYYLNTGNYEKAFSYCKTVIDATDYKSIRTLRLFGDILEACLELIVQIPDKASGLWEWTKDELKNKPWSSWYGNLYTKGMDAAKAVNDPYGEEIEEAYVKWMRDIKLR